VDIGTKQSPVFYEVDGERLGGAYLGFGGNKIVTVGVTAKADYGKGALVIEGGIEGWLSLRNGNFTFEGELKACGLWGRICFAHAKALVSKIGVEACVEVFPEINFYFFKTPAVRAGARMKWGKAPSFMVAACDVGSYRQDISTGRRRVAGQTGTTVTVPADTQIQVLRFHGDGAPPKIRMHGPNGEVVEEDPGVLVDFTKSFIVQDSHANTSVVTLLKPAAGTWTAEPLDGTTITSVDAAHDEPRPAVRGTVTKATDGGWQLDYAFVPYDGVGVSFQEVGADNASQQELGKAPTTCANPCKGTIKFNPALGYGGPRNIQVVITRDGRIIDTQPFASYVAPDLKPGKVSQIHLTRRGMKLQACWNAAANATRYEVAGIEVVDKKAKNGDGYQLMGDPNKGRCATFPDVRPGADGLRVAVTAYDGMGQQGEPVAKLLRVPKLRLPGRVRGIRVRRAASGNAVIVSWLGASGARKYRVNVGLANGRTIDVRRGRRCHELVVRDVPTTQAVLVSIAGLGREAVIGPALTVRLAPKRITAGIGRRITTPQC
jgi:hypothetical protein